MSDRKILIKKILNYLEKKGITNKFLQAAILANIEKESNFQMRAENLNYSNTSIERIRKIFGKRMQKYTDAQIEHIKRNPEMFAEAVYGMNTIIGQSMGNTKFGDGWKYRGRGFIQITGKNNYKIIGDMIGVDLVNNPDLLITDEDVAIKATVEFLLLAIRANERNPSSLEEANRIVTQAIGGRGLNLDAGYGAELLRKVNIYAKSYIDIIDKLSGKSDVELA